VAQAANTDYMWELNNLKQYFPEIGGVLQQADFNTKAGTHLVGVRKACTASVRRAPHRKTAAKKKAPAAKLAPKKRKTTKRR